MANGIGGISGIGATTNIEALKEIVQEVIEDIIESKETDKTTTQESVDEESGLVEEKKEATSPQETKEENSLQSFAGLLTAMTSMMATMMNAMMQMLGIAQNNNKPEADNAVNNNAQTQETSQPHIYTKQEQEFLEKYEWYLKDVVAEEKLTTDPELAKSLIGSNLNWNEKIATVSSTVTDEEIEDYLQRNPDAIKQGIIESKTWDVSEYILHKGGYEKLRK